MIKGNDGVCNKNIVSVIQIGDLFILRMVASYQIHFFRQWKYFNILEQDWSNKNSYWQVSELSDSGNSVYKEAQVAEKSVLEKKKKKNCCQYILWKCNSDIIYKVGLQ